MNCQCNNPVREGESECDVCLVEQYMPGISWAFRFTPAKKLKLNSWGEDVAKALRRAYREGHNDGATEKLNFDPDSMPFDFRKAQKRHARLEKLRAEKEPR